MNLFKRMIVLLSLVAAMLAAGEEKPKKDDKPDVDMDQISPFDPQPLMRKVEERIRTDKYRFAVLGDTKHATQFPALIKLLEEDYAPDFVLTTGDMVQSGAGKVGPGYWEKLAIDTGSAMQKRPWWPAIGNHEVAGGPITSLRDLDDEDLPKHNQAAGTENFKRFYNLKSDYYSFEFRNAVFIALPFKYPKGESETWLKAELQKARENKKLIFVFNHAPFYTVGAKSKYEIENKETNITRLFREYGVLAVFSGHDHGYYRTVREGIPYLISAGGGAKIYPATRLKEALPEDVYYFGEPNSAHGDPLPEGVPVVELEPLSKRTAITPPGAKREIPDIGRHKQYYLYHSGVTGVTRITDQVDLFTLIVDVDGPSVKLKCVSVRGETFDEMILAK